MVSHVGVPVDVGRGVLEVVLSTSLVVVVAEVAAVTLEVVVASTLPVVLKDDELVEKVAVAFEELDDVDTFEAGII